MREAFSITTGNGPEWPVLRAICLEDLELLRAWKNANKDAFFYKGTISPEMQLAWFAGYCERQRDFMFVVEAGKALVGCMGFRLTDNGADCYNIIGGSASRPHGIMRTAMILMCSMIEREHDRRIFCEVLKSNRASSWYELCGFRTVRIGEESVTMVLAEDEFAALRCNYQLVQLR